MNHKKKYRISIGEFYASRTPAVIRTLLGSCVGVCLYDPCRGIGGMNHILLPGRTDLIHNSAPARYSINAMELLIKSITELGGRKEDFVVKVFGGAHILPSVTSKSLSPGPRILSLVRDFLKEEKIKIISEDTGGTDTRTIFFHTDTGDVYLKRTRPSRFIDQPASEKMLNQRPGIEAAPRSGHFHAGFRR